MCEWTRPRRTGGCAACIQRPLEEQHEWLPYPLVCTPMLSENLKQEVTSCDFARTPMALEKGLVAGPPGCLSAYLKGGIAYLVNQTEHTHRETQPHSPHTDLSLMLFVRCGVSAVLNVPLVFLPQWLDRASRVDVNVCSCLPYTISEEKEERL